MRAVFEELRDALNRVAPDEVDDIGPTSSCLIALRFLVKLKVLLDGPQHCLDKEDASLFPLLVSVSLEGLEDSLVIKIHLLLGLGLLGLLVCVPSP